MTKSLKDTVSRLANDQREATEAKPRADEQLRNTANDLEARKRAYAAKCQEATRILHGLVDEFYATLKDGGILGASASKDVKPAIDARDGQTINTGGVAVTLKSDSTPKRRRLLQEVGKVTFTRLSSGAGEGHTQILFCIESKSENTDSVDTTDGDVVLMYCGPDAGTNLREGWRSPIATFSDAMGRVGIESTVEKVRSVRVRTFGSTE